jgi:hypothetical protein
LVLVHRSVLAGGGALVVVSGICSHRSMLVLVGGIGGDRCWLVRFILVWAIDGDDLCQSFQSMLIKIGDKNPGKTPKIAAFTPYFIIK